MQRLVVTGKDRPGEVVETASDRWVHSYFCCAGWDSSCPCFVTWGESQWGQVTPRGQRIARTVSKHLASSMRFKMFNIRAHTILDSEKPSAKSRLQGRDYTLPSCILE